MQADTYNSKEETAEKQYNRLKHRVTLIDITVSLVLLGFIAFSGISQFISDWTAAFSANSYIRFLLFLMFAGILFALFTLPLDFYSGYILEHRYNLSHQTLLKWIIEKFKSALVNLIIGAPLALAFYFFLVISGPMWWLYFSAALVFFSVILSSLAPVFIFPVFYKFKPLDDDNLRIRIEQMLKQNNIPVSGIFSFNLSKNTRKANAAFAGIGKSRRIILSDTLLERFNLLEICVIFAHEMGHYRRHHILKNILLSTLIYLLGFYVCGTLYEGTISALGYPSIHDIAAIPILFLYLTIFGLIIMPVINYISRRFEVEADAFALEITGDRESFITCMNKLASLNLAEIDPHPLVEFFFYSHPSISRRINFAREY